jgi:hypothetical protein
MQDPTRSYVSSLTPVILGETSPLYNDTRLVKREEKTIGEYENTQELL